MRTKRQQVLWRRFQPSLIEEWTVYLCDPKHPALAGRYGSANFLKLEIHIAWNQTYGAIVSTFLHEFDHVKIHVASLPGRWEEDLVTGTEDRAVLGMLTFGVGFPPVPDEVLPFLKPDKREASAMEILAA